jgi:hypothetical protein
MPLVLILQDKTTGVQVVLEPDLPDEAFEQLLVFDLAAIRRGPLHYDQRRRQWRSELDEATALHLRHTELLGGPCRSAQALPSNLHYGSSGFGPSLLMTARSSPRSPIAGRSGCAPWPDPVSRMTTRSCSCCASSFAEWLTTRRRIVGPGGSLKGRRDRHDRPILTVLANGHSHLVEMGSKRSPQV